MYIECIRSIQFRLLSRNQSKYILFVLDGKEKGKAGMEMNCGWIFNNNKIINNNNNKESISMWKCSFFITLKLCL